MKRLLILAAFLNAKPVLAKIVYFGSDREKITISQKATTILRFPEEVKTISQAEEFEIKPADEGNPDYRVLAIKARYPEGKRPISFILANDVVIDTLVYVVRDALPEKTDAFYDFKPKEIELARAHEGADLVSDLDLMKAMIRGDEVIGYKVERTLREVKSGVDTLKVSLVKLYVGPKFNGYVFRIENTDPTKEFGIDVKSLALGKPNSAIMSQVDDGILGSKKVTHLRIVAKPASVFYSLALPVAEVEGGKDGRGN